MKQQQPTIARLIGDWRGESLTQRLLICESVGLNCSDCGRNCPLSETKNKNEERIEDVNRANV